MAEWSNVKGNHLTMWMGTASHSWPNVSAASPLLVANSLGAFGHFSSFSLRYYFKPSLSPQSHLYNPCLLYL